MTPGGVIRVLGEVMVDTVAISAGPLSMATDTPARIRDFDGGSAANLACWLSDAGAHVELIACVGDDVMGHRAIESVTRHGVAPRIRRSSDHATGRCIVIVTPDAERTMLPDPGANVDLRPQDLHTHAWTADDHLHVSGYSLMRPGAQDAAQAALAAARAAGMTVSIDASSSAPLRTMPGAGILGSCASGDVLFANADEAEVLTGESDPAEAALALARSGLLAVVKAGARGAYLAEGSRTIHAPAEVADVVDTTGAGDAFAAGFLAAWCTGAGAPAALATATRLAARAVGRPGGRP